MKVWKFAAMLILAGTAAGLFLSTFLNVLLLAVCVFAFVATLSWGSAPRHNGNENTVIAKVICLAIIMFLVPMHITALVATLTHFHFVSSPGASWFLR